MSCRFISSILPHHRPWTKQQLCVINDSMNDRLKNLFLTVRHISYCQRCLQYKKLELPPKQTDKSQIDNDANSDEHRNNRQNTSLIARKMFQTRLSSKPHIATNYESFEKTSIQKKLDSLAKEIYEDVMVNNDNVSYQSSDVDKSSLLHEKSQEQDTESIENGDEDFIENILLKHELHAKPKPSPLLGTEDQTVPASKVPCVGCGALLHCQHRTVPGFLPSERFKLLSEHELHSSICQRCYYMQHCNAFMEVTSTAEDYAEIISQIKPTQSLVLMVVDVTDIPGSIVPNLANYIGRKHPLIVVGNKADLVAPDSTSYLASFKHAISDACTAAGLMNLRQVCLISAKTGFGIEKLINVLFSYYEKRVDVFIIGTANAGKSSLFNTLLASDYCRQTARDLIQRATVSVWPGTTLNLLKFPIMRPTPRSLALRTQRLKHEKAMKKEELKQRKKKTKGKQEKWILKDEITVTDVRTSKQIVKDESGSPWGQDVFAYQGGGKGIVAPNIAKSKFAKEIFDASHYTHSYWVYDTPGVINTEQTFNLLEPEDCTALQPANAMNPRCVVLNPGTTMFVSGLARLDYIEGEETVMATVHSSSDIPIQVVSSEQADNFYLDNLGSAQFGIPTGDPDKLNQIPSLVAKEITLEGTDENEAVADIQFSSIGWVSIATQPGSLLKLRAYTPGRKGIHLRQPALLPRFTQFKGKKIKGSPFFWPRRIGSPVVGRELNININVNNE